MLGNAAGQTRFAAALLAANASHSKTCESSPVLHLAVCLGAQPGCLSKAEQLVQILLAAGAETEAKSAPCLLSDITCHVWSF